MRVPQTAPLPDLVRPPAAPSAVAGVLPAYAGFWLRAVAFMIDTLILSVPFTICAILYPDKLMVFPEEGAPLLQAFPHFTVIGFLLLFFVMWIYYAFFESSTWQATPGKRLLKLYVVDMNGRPLTFARASGRYLGRKVSDLTFLVGYIVAGFTQKKQALHDLLSGCLVLRRR